MLDSSVTLDREQLREVTLEDADLMQEILGALVEDTSQSIQLMEAAIKDRDAGRCLRLSHYSKGACANVGALSAAALLRHVELLASAGEFLECGKALTALAVEVGRLREEVRALQIAQHSKP